MLVASRLSPESRRGPRCLARDTSTRSVHVHERWKEDKEVDGSRREDPKSVKPQVRDPVGVSKAEREDLAAQGMAESSSRTFVFTSSAT